ncbi:MAG: type I-E CRISPR-associated protein Cse1/CasA, partial [ANME-2 cluster archaeon]|nr:type I-E CRISPR-associated protein Cse1/CasA [ANME-2 cluster archaeon]
MINEKWIPVRRADGKREIIAPWQVTDYIGSNPIVSLDANRPDFNGALIQFLIGLVQTTMAPKKDRNWRAGFVEPPKTDELKTAFAKVSHAFNLDGDGPRFMQDLEPGEWKSNEIDKLLVEIPGDETIKDNADHFIKRDSVKRMCLACSAMALFTLQTNAPSGGKGYRTSLRGGGPLTTIVTGDTLWQTIWLNVLNESDFLENCGNSS